MPSGVLRVLKIRINERLEGLRDTMEDGSPLDYPHYRELVGQAKEARSVLMEIDDIQQRMSQESLEDED